MGRKVLLLIIFSLPLAPCLGMQNSDEDIIKNLEFFQNMEMLKDEMAFTQQPNLTKSNEMKDDLNKVEKKSSDPERK